MLQLHKCIEKFKKIIPSLIEGRFLRKFGIFIKSLIIKADRQIGILAKLILSLTTPVQNNKIMFITFQGDYTCNPKYITEYLLNHNLNYELV